MTVLSLHHVQLAMPAGGEEAARSFYTGVLGMRELPKPPNLAPRGGAWFTSGSAHLHLGVEADFHPACKAHPALLVEGLAGIAARCEALGYPARHDEPLEGYMRVYLSDPFGNRLELLEEAGGGGAGKVLAPRRDGSHRELPLPPVSPGHSRPIR